MNDSDLVLGIDGGGTKTVAWLATAQQTPGDTIVGRGQGGPSNVRAVGTDRRSAGA